jgi:hypothetical protein
MKLSNNAGRSVIGINCKRRLNKPVILATLEAEIRGTWFEASAGKIVWETLSQKYPIEKRAGGVTKVAEHLPSKHVLHSNPSTATKKEKKKMTKLKLTSTIQLELN